MSAETAAGPRVLIVEDEVIQAMDLKAHLRSLGYRTCGTVSNGEDAVREALASAPDLVLMDINLKGGMDGVDASVAIRSQRPVPVIFVTAFSDDETIARVQDSSPYGYIIKPFRERDLKICMEMALAKFRYESMLVRARQLAEANDRAKSRFLATISHELKTPLNALIGFNELALSLAADAEQVECLTMAGRGARRLGAVIESLLDYTMLESGSHISIPATFGLRALLDRALDLYADEARAKGLALTAELAPSLPSEAYGDAGKLGSILGSLVDNAVKFTCSGFIRVAASRADGDALVLLVEDSGKGMEDLDRSEAFRAFTQGDDSPTRAYGGLGLGLTVAKGLCEVIGGRIEYSPRQGGGSSMRVVLPGAFALGSGGKRG